LYNLQLTAEEIKERLHRVQRLSADVAVHSALYDSSTELIRIDLGYTIEDGSEIKFKSPVDAARTTGLAVYYPNADGTVISTEFAFADAHGNNVGAVDHLFAENAVVKVILDLDTNNAFVQNADTNVYLESRLGELSEAIEGTTENLDEHKHVIADVTDITTTATELNQLSGINSNVQSQLDTKVSNTLKINDKALSADIYLTADDIGAAETIHSHDELYYTEAEVDAKFALKSDADHNHSLDYDTKGAAADVQSNLDAHTTSADIHVTADNKTDWDNAKAHADSAHARIDATKVVGSDINGNILINDTETKVYAHPVSEIAAGTYKSITVDANGHVTAGTNPTTLAEYGITDAEQKGAAEDALAAAQEYTNTIAASKSDSTHDHDSKYVPIYRTVNGKPLTADVLLSASDIGALPDTTSIPNALSDLVSDATHQTVTDTEKAAWNAKSNFSGNYDDLSNKPEIPSISGLATETYATTVATNAANAVKNDLLNGAGDAYDTLKELGDLIVDNQDAIDALETVATGKADKIHTHAISDVSDLQTALDEKADVTHTHTLENFGINATTTELNYLTGLTSNLQAQLNNLATVQIITWEAAD
jgi:hypothetical protein